VEGEWWKAFGSPALDGLVAQALAANNDIQVAQATLKQASELTRVARGGLFPDRRGLPGLAPARWQRAVVTPADANALAVHAAHRAGQPDLYADLFGETRSRIRSAQAATRAQQARLAGVKTMVAGNTALAVIQNAALEAQADAARSAVASNRDILNLLRQRQALGAVGAADVAAQEALAAAEGALPPLDRALSANRSALQVLGARAGRAPACPALARHTDAAGGPAAQPAVRSRRHPARRRRSGDDGRRGGGRKTAIAARLPSITLGANAGGAALDFASMFATGNPFWALIGSIGAPLFHGGSRATSSTRRKTRWKRPRPITAPPRSSPSPMFRTRSPRSRPMARRWMRRTGRPFGQYQPGLRHAPVAAWRGRHAVGAQRLGHAGGSAPAAHHRAPRG
jgi:outer membrane protein TolC